MSAIGMCVASALNPTVDQWQVMPYNPLGIDRPAPLFELLESVTTIAVPGLLVTSVTAMIVRFRRSGGVERLQLMWLVYAITLVAVLVMGDAVLRDIVSQQTSDVVYGIAYGMLPVAVAVAVLHYQLYDIERVIRRTVVYALVSAAVAIVYASSTIMVGNVFSARRSDFVVAISTLAAAALFRPIHRRIQTTVDRRYNRQRYDAPANRRGLQCRRPRGVGCGEADATVTRHHPKRPPADSRVDVVRGGIQEHECDFDGTRDPPRASRAPFAEAVKDLVSRRFPA